MENTKTAKSSPVVSRSLPGIHNKEHEAALIVIILLVVLLSVSGFAYFLHARSTKINSSKIASYNYKLQTCKQGLTELRHEQPTTTDLKGSVQLLNYRSYCLINLGKYNEAINSLKQLKEYYLKLGDQNTALTTQQEIGDAQYNISHPATNAQIKSQLTPQEQQTVQKEIANNE